MEFRSKKFRVQAIFLLSVFQMLISCNSESQRNADSSQFKYQSPQKIETDCIRNHLSEAIHLNTERSALYSAASEGRSEAVSNKILRMESVMMVMLPLIEVPARYFQNRGVPVLCKDVVPMSGAAEFVAKTEPPEADFESISGWSLARELIAARFDDNPDAFDELLESKLKDLSNKPYYNCLTRHFLESILRAARLGPIYLQMAQERDLFSPRPIILNYLYSQILSLPLVTAIDDDADILHKEGIPVICRDVPVIPVDIEGILGEFGIPKSLDIDRN